MKHYCTWNDSRTENVKTHIETLMINSKRQCRYTHLSLTLLWWFPNWNRKLRFLQNRMKPKPSFLTGQWRPIWRFYFSEHSSRLETTASAFAWMQTTAAAFYADAADLLVYYGRRHGQQVGYHGRVNMVPEPDCESRYSLHSSLPCCTVYGDNGVTPCRKYCAGSSSSVFDSVNRVVNVITSSSRRDATTVLSYRHFITTVVMELNECSRSPAVTLTYAKEVMISQKCCICLIHAQLQQCRDQSVNAQQHYNQSHCYVHVA